ncbi:glycerophosphodiester phosphodiesterase family protein [Tenacibaculum jejuense]|uniref:Cytoplasmic glycerophosphodiester phosphodiesterase n=1 Tax=Tenacibaculum jejuense TaxID=584609 RepID=A0A238U8Q0_9FLAO|nr:glycerophosphodiester phosphodiesterase family protein [Tenacibaculum jejuense]SNR15425.1 Cytoplasmic glycerophosphodiester phosphodiesterase [Tenacibaculum jejuense]
MRFSKIGLVLVFSSILCVACKTNEVKEVKTQATQEKTTFNDALVTSFSAWKKNPVPLVSAHRGGPYPGYPENAIETFNNIVKHTSTVIECDVAMSKDSVLVLMHDRNLDRTTTGTGAIKETSFEALQKLRLVDNNGTQTDFKIPTLDEVLSWGKNKVLFTLDVKRGVPFAKVLELVEKHNATDYAAIITYRVSDAKLVHELNKEVMISVSARDEGALVQIEKANLPADKLLGFVGTRQPDEFHYKKLKEKRIKTILGTLGNLDKSAVAKGNDDVYITYLKNGANIIATDRPLEVAKVIKKHQTKS